MTAGYEARRRALLEDLARLGRVAVAFSGGVDSSVLLHAAHAALGDGALAVIADSPSLPRSELALARRTAAEIGARLVEVRTSELADPDYRANGGDRCYHCKTALFRALDVVCAAEGIRTQAFGEIADDAQDDRPGVRAARERGVLAPLVRAGFAKRDVRRYAREAGLSVAEKPAGACLASRIPRGTPVTAERLAAVEVAEDAIHRLGIAQLRVRHRGRRARLEVGEEELENARRLAVPIAAALRTAGFEDFELAAYVPPGRLPTPTPERAPDRPAPRPISRS